jgi:hypothetical protein
MTVGSVAGLACAGVLLTARPGMALNGEEWRRLTPPARDAYVAGIVDAWTGFAVVKESLGSRDTGITVFSDLVACLQDRAVPPARIFDIVKRYTDDHPGLLGKDMPDIVFAALGRECRK